eukprot:UN00887
MIMHYKNNKDNKIVQNLLIIHYNNKHKIIQCDGVVYIYRYRYYKYMIVFNVVY